MTNRDVEAEPQAVAPVDEVYGETTEEQDKRQIEVFVLRQDFDRALGLAREVVAALTSPGRPITGGTMRNWRERLHTLERGAQGRG